jgi:hypothetical protein
MNRLLLSHWTERLAATPLSGSPTVSAPRSWVPSISVFRASSDVAFWPAIVPAGLLLESAGEEGTRHERADHH